MGKDSDKISWVSHVILLVLFLGSLIEVDRRYEPKNIGEVIVGYFMLPGDMLLPGNHYPKDFIDHINGRLKKVGGGGTDEKI